MPRKKTQKAAEDLTVIANDKAIKKDSKTADKLYQRLATIDTLYGNDLLYDVERIIEETRFYLSQTAGAMLEAGRRLILLKEHEQHGEFQNALEKIGLAARTARQMMQAAAKYSDPKRAALIDLGKTKMIELMMEDDESLDELADGGTIAGMALDDVDKMTSRELRKALRKAREQREAEAEVHEKLLESKDKKINKLHAQVHDRKNKTPEWDVRVKEYQLETTHIAAAILEALDRLDVMRDAFINDEFGDENDAASSAMAAVYYDSIRQITGRTAQVAEDCDTVFGAYAEVAMPMLDYWAEKFESK